MVIRKKWRNEWSYSGSMYGILNIENHGLLNSNIENVSVWRIIALLDQINLAYSQIMLVLYSALPCFMPDWNICRVLRTNLSSPPARTSVTTYSY